MAQQPAHAARPRRRLIYSRIGFADEHRPLAQAVAAVARITRGNFRLIDRLFTQVERVMNITELSTIADDVIEAAHSTLVIGIS